MHDQLSLELAGDATIRLVNDSWASYLQQLCRRMKTIGQLHQADGITTLIQRLKQTRPSTYAHCVRVTKIAHTAGRAFGFDELRLKQLTHTAMLHDIGKILVPEAILNRPRKPTRFEQFILRLHPSFGAVLASYFNLTAELRIRTHHHHERWDGQGYPHRLSGTDIPLMARIVQVADTYDAMVAVRPYRAAVSHREAVGELRQEASKQFDPRVVEAFLDTMPTDKGDQIEAA